MNPLLRMPQRSNHILRVGVFYDGMTFKLISNYYRFEHWRQARLSFLGIRHFGEQQIQALAGRPARIIEQHLFIGVKPTQGQAEAPELPESVLAAMLRSGITVHRTTKPSRREKGVDISLTLEMARAAWEQRIDVAILLATDGDFAPLVAEVSSRGIPVILLAFHIPSAPRRPVCLSPALRDAATEVLDIPELIDRPSSPYGELFWTQ